MSSFTSDEVNLLVYRYLQESGFSHAAFTFRSESRLPEDLLRSERPRRGVLINYIQKGLVYEEIDTHIKKDGSEVNCSQPFSLTQPHICKEEQSVFTLHKERETLESEVSSLASHSKEVFACQWNPKRAGVLATGSADSTAVIWRLPTEGPSGPAAGAEAVRHKHVMRHMTAEGFVAKDVTTLEWSPDGTRVATGSYDGGARIWTAEGQLIDHARGHNGPIFSLRWTSDGQYLLSGGVDRTARIWNVGTGQEMRKYELHSAPTLDVAWRNDTSFASCSTDKSITYCRWDNTTPVMRWREHTDEVNAVVWSPDANLLGSCSDDKTMKLWQPDSAKSLCTMTGHEREIYTLRWRPAGPGSTNPNLNARVLSASFDGTARLWDVETAKCVKKFPRHKQPVYAIAFSPDGQYCVVGSFDKTVEVYHVDSGQVVQSYTGPGGVFDVAWSPHADQRIAVACSAGHVRVFDAKLP